MTYMTINNKKFNTSSVEGVFGNQHSIQKIDLPNNRKVFYIKFSMYSNYPVGKNKKVFLLNSPHIQIIFKENPMNPLEISRKRKLPTINLYGFDALNAVPQLKNSGFMTPEEAENLYTMIENSLMELDFVYKDLISQDFAPRNTYCKKGFNKYQIEMENSKELLDEFQRFNKSA